MMKKAIFFSAFMAFMLSTQLVFAQPLNGSQLNLNNTYIYTHPKTGQTVSLNSIWNLKFINNNELTFSTTGIDVLRFSSSQINAEKTLRTNDIVSNTTITSNNIIAL